MASKIHLTPPPLKATAAACSKAANLLLFIHCVLLLILFVIFFVYCPCLVMQFLVSFLVLHLAEEERAGCFTFLLDVM